MAHEIAFGDSVERGESHYSGVEPALRQERLHPRRVEFHESLRGRHANLFGIDPAEGFARFDEMAQVSGGGARAHASQRFDGFHFKIVGSFWQELAFRKTQKF